MDGKAYFISTNRYMSLRYDWHYKVPHKFEFEASFQAIHRNDRKCQSTVVNLSATNSSRHFTSPLFPSFSLPNQVCTWLITAPEGHVVRLQFSHFVIHTNNNCKGYFAARDGTNSTDPLLVKLCGSNQRCPVFSSGRFMWLRFETYKKYYNQYHNQFWTKRNAFRATFAAIKQVPEKLLQGNGTFNISLTKQDIRGNLSDIKCLWNLTAPSKTFINLSIELTSPARQGCYLQERLEVIDGPQLGGHLLTTRSWHFLKARAVTSSGQHLLLRLLPNQQGTSCLFQIHFRIWRNISDAREYQSIIN
ncbi:cubilin-like [Exaiptasia diaphana]|uniref:CUB domain-containing protein n=1 Tax=Exaiptasia diaphana TaxID=2652724 RepID=A0A913YDW5_EXADI|nr:cubilin-like [Exaiptasia diaphana]